MDLIQITPDDPKYLSVLGIALCRTGDWHGAIKPLEKSETIAPGKNVAQNGLHLAMAYWQTGDKEKARDWYEKALKWMNEHPTKDEYLTRLRAEASALLD
jgi:Flp pilus assembly protein TadD